MGNVELFASVTENLQYFTGTFVIDADGGGTGVGKISAVGIGTGWAVGDYAALTGTANSNINIKITYIHTDDSYIYATAVSEGGATVAFGADESGSGDEKMNQIYYTEWQDLSGFWEITGTVYSSGACDVYLQQSWGKTYVDVDGTKVDVSASTSTLVDEDVKCLYGRIKLLAQDADVTAMRAYFGGHARS
jgi:hypothetical protein